MEHACRQNIFATVFFLDIFTAQKIKKMKFLKLIIAVAFLPVFVTAQTIKLNLVKDTKYEVTTVTKTSSVATVMGQEMESNSDFSIVETITVKDTRVAETDLVSVINKMTANIQAMGQETVYDSDKKDNTGAMTESFDKMIGKVKNMTVDANGKIIKQDKSEEESSAATMMGVSGDGTPLINKMFISRDIKPGTTWYDSTTTKGDKMTTFTGGDYTIQAVNAGIATIVFKGITNLSGTMEQMGMEMIMNSSSKVSSQIEVEIATGVIKKNTTTSDGTMSIEAAGMSIPATTKTTATVSTRQL